MFLRKCHYFLVAQAVFRADTTGVVRVVVRVDETTQETAIVVSPLPSGGSGAESE